MMNTFNITNVYHLKTRENLFGSREKQGGHSGLEVGTLKGHPSLLNTRCPQETHLETLFLIHTDLTFSRDAFKASKKQSNQ